MYVVHVINDLEANGGAQRFVIELSKGMNDDKVSIVILKRRDGDRFDEANRCGFQVTSLWPLSIRSVFKAFVHIWNSDVIHVHLFPSLYIMALVPKRKVFTEHNTWNRRREIFWLRWLEKIVYRRYDSIISISSGTERALENWVGSLGYRSKIIYNGVDISKFTGKERVMPRGRCKIAMIARFAKQKDQDTIVRTMEILPDQYVVSFAGNGDRLNEVHQLASRLGVLDRVIFEGNVSDIADYLNGVDLYVQSSHWEGFGLAIVEAMASGIPVLGANVPGLSMVINNERQLFRCGDLKQLAEKITKICSDPLLYHELSKYSLKQARKFDLSVTIGDYKKMYEAIKRLQ